MYKKTYLVTLLEINSAIAKIKDFNALIAALESDAVFAEFYASEVDHAMVIAKADLQAAMFDLQFCTDALNLCFDIAFEGKPVTTKEMQRKNNTLMRAHCTMHVGTELLGTLIAMTDNVVLAANVG